MKSRLLITVLIIAVISSGIVLSQGCFAKPRRMGYSKLVRMEYCSQNQFPVS